MFRCEDDDRSDTSPQSSYKYKKTLSDSLIFLMTNTDLHKYCFVRSAEFFRYACAGG